MIYETFPGFKKSVLLYYGSISYPIRFAVFLSTNPPSLAS